MLRGQGALTSCTKRNNDNARNSAANIGDANKEVKRSDKSTDEPRTDHDDRLKDH
jgi:hypothetical protein